MNRFAISRTALFQLVLIAAVGAAAWASGKAWAQGTQDFDAAARRATRLHEMGQYVDATAASERALALAQAKFGAEDPRVASWLDNIAELFRQRASIVGACENPNLKVDPTAERSGERQNLVQKIAWCFQQSERYYLLAIGVREKTVGPNNPSVVKDLGRLAEIFEEQQRLPEAEDYYKRALDRAEKSQPRDEAAVRDLRSGYANVLESRAQMSDNSKESSALMKEALEMRKKSCGQDKQCLRDIQRTSSAPVVVHGVLSNDPQSGALLKGGAPESAIAWCSGTLIGCDKFLTAAHCVAEDPDPSQYQVFFQHAGFFPVRAIDWPKDVYQPQLHVGDIAVLTLAQPVEGIAPRGISRKPFPGNGTRATIVGFGRTGGDHLDYGIKREGDVTMAACPTALRDRHLICWDFNGSDEKNARWESNTCNADSGGGLLLASTTGSTSVVAGTTVGGTKSDCLSGDNSFDTDVFTYSKWIDQAGEGKLSTKACGPLGSLRFDRIGSLDLSDINDDVTDVEIASVNLSEKNDTVTKLFNTTPDLLSLRVAMNGEDDGDGDTDFDLYVVPDVGENVAATVDLSKAVCAQTGSGQFAYCNVDHPKTGRWAAVVHRKKGEGMAQLTITRIRPVADTLMVSSASRVPAIRVGMEFPEEKIFNLPTGAELALRRSSDKSSFDMRGPFKGTIAQYLLACSYLDTNHRGLDPSKTYCRK
jgi:tetratricopeptide (TPR) repeat protein